jgi:ribosomal protein S18 acetylase RimI-like enzyme
MITLAENRTHLQGILDLQALNLPANLSEQEIKEQGFVTVKHTLELLEKMNRIARHVIAVENDKVVGYVLSMDPSLNNEVPVLVPMFELLNNLQYNQQQLSSSKYIVCGQACVDKAYRNQGLLTKMYTAMKKSYSEKYNYCVTEIAVSNERSMKAHQKAGFKTIHTFSDKYQDWNIVLWDWSKTL